MLPNKMKISETATNSLRRLQGKTGLTINLSARLAFFTSIERDFRFDMTKHLVEHSGRELDKYTWLGEHALVTEFLLREMYPNSSRSQLHDAWAAHVADGSIAIEGKASISSILE
jgi:DNA sulfur modification protein DndE